MKLWQQMDVDTGARIDAQMPGIFVTTGYAESLDEQRMRACKTPACFRMWRFPRSYEGQGNVPAGRLTPGHRRQIVPVTLILGLIFDSKRGAGGEETGYGDSGSLVVVPRTAQAIVSWWPNPHFKQAFEYLDAEMSRDGTRSYWEVSLATYINDPFIAE
ncbi:MAG: hypothetical protein ACXW5J_26690 [Thermoanaerobaculia bacterium]